MPCEKLQKCNSVSLMSSESKDCWKSKVTLKYLRRIFGNYPKNYTRSELSEIRIIKKKFTKDTEIDRNGKQGCVFLPGF